jgi:hypothetical protein
LRSKTIRFNQGKKSLRPRPAATLVSVACRKKVGQLRSADVDGSDSWSTKTNGTFPENDYHTTKGRQAARLDGLRILNCCVFIPQIRLEQFYQIEYPLILKY